MISIAKTLMFSAATVSAWDYQKNGADWPSDTKIQNNQCGSTNQSPIDLPKDIGSYPVYEAKYDKWQQVYSSLENTEVKWIDGKTTLVEYQKDKKTGFGVFASWANWEKRETTHMWEAAQFHWHAHSEHTIDGKQFPIELHIVHAPSYKRESGMNGYLYAVVGLIFDDDPKAAEGWEDWEIEIIDKFFDSMKWEVKDKNPKVDDISIGDLMTIMDASNRWTYRGSLTTPPCSTSIQWNVLRRIIPVKSKHVQLFKDHHLGRYDKYDLKESGNWRVQFPVTKEHELMFIKGDKPGGGMSLLIILIVFIILCLVATVFAGYYRSKATIVKGAGDAAATAGSTQLQEYDTAQKP